MATPEQSITTGDLQRQIIALGVRMDHGFDELKELFRNSEERLRGLETREAGCQPIVTARLDAAWREIDEHETQLKVLTTSVERLEQSNKLMSWIAGIAGSALILWLIGQLLGLITK